jgi:hypothetical protein
MKMRNNQFMLALTMLILASCNVGTKENLTTENLIKANEPLNCYSYSKDSNNVLMKITIVDNLVSGDLFYQYFQKDKNTGKFKGEMSGDTLFAEYIFESEGTSSVREIAFLKNGNQCNEGFGDVQEKSGKMVFKNRNNLKFDNNMPLTKIDCDLDTK